ncbi:hypothetical protein PQC34_gp033 [Cronobacter phage A24]|uniref:Uncharacterized protein n=1 Tax=Cronobacter phage A24 TaxID=2795745 RepID=A0A7T5UFE6_9CAUD|nr:hypothetical protein PQC34_gp033 [Cronobacter phage A24]QQG33701.1 hypothetical protein [Cronobacter phage A24]
MALHDDFAMYYNGTYVGYRKEGDVVPFYIEAVDTDRSIFDYSEATESEMFGDLALSALTFYGNIDGNRVNINHDDPNLVLEMPDSKYIQFRGRYYWVSWRANRSTKKGMGQRRLSGLPHFNTEVARAMFSERSAPNVIAGCLLRQNNELHYKGVVVGSINDNEVVLVPEAAHLLRFVSREMQECQVSVQQAG